MRLLQILSFLLIVLFPYILSYTKKGLRDNHNNLAIMRTTLGYYLLSHVLRLFLVATGIPELLIKFIFPEKFIMGLLNGVLVVGMLFVFQSKNLSSAKTEHRVLMVGLVWSFLDNLTTFISEILGILRRLDYSFRPFYFAVQANVSIIGFTNIASVFLIYLRTRELDLRLYLLFVAYVLIFPVLTM